jgi:hypothetical protein
MKWPSWLWSCGSWIYSSHDGTYSENVRRLSFTSHKNNYFLIHEWHIVRNGRCLSAQCNTFRSCPACPIFLAAIKTFVHPKPPFSLQQLKHLSTQRNHFTEWQVCIYYNLPLDVLHIDWLSINVTWAVSQ